MERAYEYSKLLYFFKTMNHLAAIDYDENGFCLEGFTTK